jgi:hypothetical protein
MEHQDGYCDRCGCEVDDVQLTFDGLAICDSCSRNEVYAPIRVAKKPEARDDGR